MKNNILQNNVIQYLDTIIKIGIENKASDIHIRYNDYEIELKYRIDGVLLELEELYNIINKKNIENNIVEIISRLKILSNMNVAEKRKPQDGSFSFFISSNKNKEKYDIRTAFLPVVNGESIVLRILKNFLEDIELSTLGYNKKSKAIIEKMLKKKYGMILVSGPTGSGKSTTLLSMISKLNDSRKKIISIEDPVENKINGITQVQVNNDIGVSFSEVLKNSLRNDPDIIVISEIRDEETAQIAIRAALTGHLVISTIHTNDTISTIARLVDMGIPKYLVIDSIIGIIAQRLISKKDIKTNTKNGRTTINEILYFSDNVKEIIKKMENKKEIKEKLTNKKDDFIEFYEDIYEKLKLNIIFEEDVLEYIHK